MLCSSFYHLMISLQTIKCFVEWIIGLRYKLIVLQIIDWKLAIMTHTSIGNERALQSYHYHCFVNECMVMVRKLSLLHYNSYMCRNISFVFWIKNVITWHSAKCSDLYTHTSFVTSTCGCKISKLWMGLNQNISNTFAIH